MGVSVSWGYFYPLCLEVYSVLLWISTHVYVNNRDNNDKGRQKKIDTIHMIKYHNLFLLVKFILKSELKARDLFGAGNSMSGDGLFLLSCFLYRVTTNSPWKEENQRDLIK